MPNPRPAELQAAEVLISAVANGRDCDMIFSLFRQKASQSVIDRLHGEIMAVARQPLLFSDFGVADTFEGRFEILAAAASPPLRRLMLLPEPGPTLAQQLTDAFFTHFDDALREVGTSDVGVPKKIKALASAWLGRRQAYVTALESGNHDALAQALARNVYAGQVDPGDAKVRRLAIYIGSVDAALAQAGIESFTTGPLPVPVVQSIGA